jgi:hypothetical protein
MKKMKKIIVFLLFAMAIPSMSAQMYSEPEKVKVKGEKTKKNAPAVDSSKSYMSTGLVISGIGGFTRGVATRGYQVNYYGSSSNYYDYISETYTIKNKMGLRLGVGIGFESRSFKLEVPLAFNVDRFKVPEISAKDRLRIPSVEFGINEYFKILKEKHFIVLGQYMSLNAIDLFSFELHSLGLNLGYGYNVNKRLHASIRYKFNLFSIFSDASVEAFPDSYYTEVYSNYNSLQLLVAYDLVNTRKLKYKKKKEDSYSNENIYIPPPPKPAINYAGYSDSDLNLALKEATAKGDLDAMLAIQKEIDKRKQTNELSKYSYVQLQQMLNKAVDSEDYAQAELIKKEMAKRDAQNGMPAGNSDDKLENKSLEELKKLKNEAVEKEDYDRAKVIQDAINKKNPN